MLDVGKMVDAVLDAVDKPLHSLHERIKALEARISELEVRPQVKYLGIWNAQKIYTIGNLVTDHGSMWHCVDTCVGARPGSSDAWQLAVKRGSDGKDARGSR